MKQYLTVIFNCIFLGLFLIGCTKNESIVYFNQKVEPIFLINDKFSTLLQDSIFRNNKIQFSTFGAQFDEYSNRMTVKPINVRGANFIDKFSRFQIVQYDDDFNGIFSGSIDKIFINTFNNKYLHTINYSNYVNYTDVLVFNVSDLHYQIQFLKNDQVKIQRTHQQQADLVISDRMPNIKLQNLKGQQLDLYVSLRP